MTDLRGRYPGGPTRRTGDEDVKPLRGKARLSTVEEIENRAIRNSQARKSESRRRRLLAGVVVSIVLALALGSYLGFSSHRTGEELAREMETAREQEGKSDVDRQMDRLIDEMWKSEALERTSGIR